MAYRKKYRKSPTRYRRRRTYYSKRRYHKRKSSGAHMRVPLFRAMPNEMRCILNYSDYFGLTSPSAGVDIQTMRITSLYDLDYSVGGHQPRYYDVFCNGTAYNNYQVLGVKYDIRFRNKTTTDATVGIQAIPSGSTQLSTPQQLYDSNELNYTKSGLITAQANAYPERRFKGYLSLHRLRGVSKSTYLADQNYWGQYNSNPTSNYHLDLLCGDDPVINGTSTVEVFLKLELYVRFFNLTRDQPLN